MKNTEIMTIIAAVLNFHSTNPDAEYLVDVNVARDANHTDRNNLVLYVFTDPTHLIEAWRDYDCGPGYENAMESAKAFLKKYGVEVGD